MEIENKKILMISFRTPWPSYQGGYILRILNVAKILAKNYKVDLLTLIENDKERKYLKDLEKIFNQVIYFNHSKIKEYFSALKTLLSSKPLQVGYYWSPGMANWIRNNYQNYDLLYFNTIRTVDYAESLKVPKILDLIDAISLNYSSARKWVNFFWKMIYIVEAPRTLRYELNIFKKNNFNKVFIASPFDKEYFKKNLGYSVDNLIVLPNGVKGELLERKLNKEENWISFFGKIDYQPNEDAVIYFAKKVFFEIKKEIPDLKFYIIGMNPTGKVKDLAKKKGIEVTGFLENPYPLLEKSKIIVAPLRFGAGIQNKVLEAMALRKVVVTTEIGAGGISGVKDGEHLLITDFKKPKEVVKRIIYFLKDDQSRKKIGENARAFIFKNYTWEKAEKILFANFPTTI